MARPTVGKVLEHVGKDGRTYRSLRFVAYGKRRFDALGAVSVERAEEKLRHTIADVERGTWKPPAAIEPLAEPIQVPTFHAFSETWWTLNEGEWTDNTRSDYRWRLERHLLPFFGEMPIDQITGATVKRYVAKKLIDAKAIREAAAKGEPMMREISDRHGRTHWQSERPMTPRSINMTVILLGAIMESAIDDDEIGDLIARNPARGRRVREKSPRRSYLDAAAPAEALLGAAGELDRKAKRDRRHIERRAMIATLLHAGLRIGELCDLRWRDVDLAGGWLSTGSKTDAGRRKVKIRGGLRDELAALRGRHQDAPQSSYVFGTRSGARMSPSNFRNRVLAAAVELANEHLEADGLPPLPERITPHSLRRTFCSFLYALNTDPGVVMDEMGHTDPALALRVYRQATRRGEGENAKIQTFMEGGIVAFGGIRDADRAVERSEPEST